MNVTAYPKSDLRNPPFLRFFGALLVAVTRFHPPPPQVHGAIFLPAFAIFCLPHELHSYTPERIAFDPDFGMIPLSLKPVL